MSIFSFGQNQEKNLYNWLDEKIGLENVNIHNGKQYHERFQPKTDKHSFFISSQFTNGNVFYNGEVYSNLSLKYDLFEQELIVQFQKNITSTGIAIQLFKNNITSFDLHDTHFVKIESKDVKGLPVLGFYQEAFSNASLKLLVKHSKHKKEVPYLETMLVEYNKNNHEYYIFYKNQYIKIKSKRNVINIFPSLKSQINTFYKKYTSLSKTDETLFLERLLKDLVSNNNL